MMLKLQERGGVGISVDLVQPKINFGRDPSNDVELSDESISGFHGCLFVENGRIEYADLGSTNGSYLNGNRLQGRVELKAWDRLKLGNLELEIIDTEERRPTQVQAAISDEDLAPTYEIRSSSYEMVLECLSPGNYPKTVGLNGRVNVGRLPGNDLILQSDAISSKHAELVPTGNGLEVVDLDSTNGTFVNGEKVQRRIVYPGDVVTFDQIEYRLKPQYDSAGEFSVNPAEYKGNTVVRTSIDLEDENTKTAVEIPAVEPLTEEFDTFSDERIQSYAEETHYESLAANMDNDRINLISLFLFPGGRIGRLRYILSVLGLNIGFWTATILVLLVLDTSITEEIIRTLSYLNSILLLWPVLCLAIKRLHDTGRSAHLLWLLAPSFAVQILMLSNDPPEYSMSLYAFSVIVGIYPAIVILFFRGQPGANQYGQPPA